MDTFVRRSERATKARTFYMDDDDDDDFLTKPRKKASIRKGAAAKKSTTKSGAKEKGTKPKKQEISTEKKKSASPKKKKAPQPTESPKSANPRAREKTQPKKPKARPQSGATRLGERYNTGIEVRNFAHLQQKSYVFTDFGDEQIQNCNDEEMLQKMLEDCNKHIEVLELELSHNLEGAAPDDESDDEDYAQHILPPHAIPINKDLNFVDWQGLGKLQQFDVVLMDPAWSLTSANPTRGVALGYSQLTDKDLDSLFNNIRYVQSNGFLFVWVINRFYSWTIDTMRKYGYEIIDEIAWVKLTTTRKWAKSHGFYLQHGKETCIVGLKGNPPANFRGNISSDIIFSERRGQSQKPHEIYELIEELVPNGSYLECFARRNNLRNFWTSIGLEL